MRAEVTTAGSLLSKDQKTDFLENTKTEYNKLREDFANKKTVKQYLSFADAQKNPVQIDWDNYTPPSPSFTGIKVFEDYNLNEIRQYIDWGPFFIAWEMKGKYPAILSDPHAGAEATKLFNDANAMLDKIVAEKWLKAKGVVGFWETLKTAPDTIVVKDENGKELTQLQSLRQQIKKQQGNPIPLLLILSNRMIKILWAPLR